MQTTVSFYFLSWVCLTFLKFNRGVRLCELIYFPPKAIRLVMAPEDLSSLLMNRGTGTHSPAILPEIEGRSRFCPGELAWGRPAEALAAAQGNMLPASSEQGGPHRLLAQLNSQISLEKFSYSSCDTDWPSSLGGKVASILQAFHICIHCVDATSMLTFWEGTMGSSPLTYGIMVHMGVDIWLYILLVYSLQKIFRLLCSCCPLHLPEEMRKLPAGTKLTHSQRWLSGEMRSIAS